MKRKVIAEVLLTLLMFSAADVVFMVVPASASNTIYVYTDWKLTADILNEPVVILADNIVLDLNGYGIIARKPAPQYDDAITCHGRTGVTIKNGRTESWLNGISLYDSSNNVIENVNMSKNVITGISLGGSGHGRGSNNNIIRGCTIVSDAWFGVFIGWYCEYNLVQNCLITSVGSGIELFYRASRNTITDNEISHNSIGVNNGRYNAIYHNNFIDNSIQATGSSLNSWDDGYPSGGNYWSDYTGVDLRSGPNQDQPGSDGIGDTPRVISGSRQDNYPLMQPDAQVEIRTLEKTIVSMNLQKGTEKSLTQKLDAAIDLLDQGNTNGAVHKLGDFINQVTNSNKLTDEQKDMLITAAQAIIGHIQ